MAFHPVQVLSRVFKVLQRSLYNNYFPLRDKVRCDDKVMKKIKKVLFFRLFCARMGPCYHILNDLGIPRVTC